MILTDVVDRAKVYMADMKSLEIVINTDILNDLIKEIDFLRTVIEDVKTCDTCEHFKHGLYGDYEGTCTLHEIKACECEKCGDWKWEP